MKKQTAKPFNETREGKALRALRRIREASGLPSVATARRARDLVGDWLAVSPEDADACKAMAEAAAYLVNAEARAARYPRHLRRARALRSAPTSAPALARAAKDEAETAAAYLRTRPAATFGKPEREALGYLNAAADLTAAALYFAEAPGLSSCHALRSALAHLERAQAADPIADALPYLLQALPLLAEAGEV